MKEKTLRHVKELYMRKIQAIENGDNIELENLKFNHPELFNAAYLMDVLKAEIDRVRQGLNDDVIFRNDLFKYH